MHRDLTKLLPHANGRSTKVVAMFLDVRGFTAFFAESTDAAEYLKSAYRQILKRYVGDCDFFKLTGDGMMVIYELEEADLRATLRATVKRSLDLVQAFPSITDGDAMINFAVPERLGIGLARGSATVITSGRKTLDYTGRTLNLAARLMDLARPSGVVLDGDFGLDLLPPKLRQEFTQDRVFIDGISPETPYKVFCQKRTVKISEHRRLPIAPPVDFIESLPLVSLKQIAELGRRHQYNLTHEPAQLDTVRLLVRYPKPRPDGRKSGASYMPDFNAVVGKRLKRWFAEVDYQTITQRLESDGCKPGWPVEQFLEYQVRAESDVDT